MPEKQEMNETLLKTGSEGTSANWYQVGLQTIQALEIRVRKAQNGFVLVNCNCEFIAKDFVELNKLMKDIFKK